MMLVTCFVRVQVLQMRAYRCYPLQCLSAKTRILQATSAAARSAFEGDVRGLVPHLSHILAICIRFGEPGRSWVYSTARTHSRGELKMDSWHLPGDQCECSCISALMRQGCHGHG